MEARASNFPSWSPGALHLLARSPKPLNIRLTEHKRATRNSVIYNHIAEHHLKTNHRSTGTLLHALPTVRTTFNESLWKAGLLT